MQSVWQFLFIGSSPRRATAVTPCHPCSCPRHTALKVLYASFSEVHISATTCLVSWRLFYGWTSNFWTKSHCNITFDLPINMGHGDLYFMVQWFCLISQRLFDGWVSYFRIMRQCNPIFDLKISIGQHDLYFMVQWFFLTSWRQFWWMNIKLLDNESVWHSHWPWNKCRSEWPIFLGPEILTFISRTIWWMSVILLDYETMWPNLWPENNDLDLRSRSFALYLGRLFDGWTSNF